MLRLLTATIWRANHALQRPGGVRLPSGAFSLEFYGRIIWLPDAANPEL